jgi:mutator protein MutT
MSRERFTIPTASYLILRDNKKVLMMRRCNTGYQDGNYNLPAGHIDEGETASEAILREAEEEVGVQVESKDIEMRHVVHRVSDDGTVYVDFYFETDKWKGTPNICEPEKCDKLEWFALDNLPENMSPDVRLVLHRIDEGYIYTEFGWG